MKPHDLAERFLRIVWGAQPQVQPRFSVLATKDQYGSQGWEDKGLAGAVVPERLPNAKRVDVYFTPCIFSKPRRNNRYALPSRWLYADLDEVDPRSLALKPTVAIESSPGRYQAMWLLTRPLPIKQFRALNQRLTYATGADRGGWAQNKVLRVPGTVNHKYDGRPRVKLMWFKRERVYTAKQVLKYVRQQADVSATPVEDSDTPDLPNTTAAHLRKRYRSKLGRRARKLLTVKRVMPSEDRSARIWELENLCLDAGMTPEETLIVVRSCAYNKYKGQRRETRMLWAEIRKCVAVRKRNAPEPDDEPDEADDETEEDTGPIGLAPTRLARYLARDVRPPSWLVEHIWGRAAHGVWAGDFKTYKSTLLMDLAVSVASGRPFLGKFDVHRTGPVLYIQEENSHGFMHDRLHRIVQAKGLGNAVHNGGKRRTPTIEFGHDLDLHLLNLTGFDLTKRAHLDGLEEWAVGNQPALIILDPLYRLAPGIDENSQHEMAPILNALADVSNRSDAALVLAHHYNKPNAGNASMRSGHRISGTSVFSRWWESSVYAERSGDADAYSIKFHNEHREHGNAAPQVVTVEMNAGDPDAYAIHLADVAKEVDDEGEDRDHGLSLDTRSERIPVMTVRSKLGLSSSRDAQKLLKGKGYDIRKAKVNGKLWGYPPSR